MTDTLPRPALRRLPTPECEPPYDDVLAGEQARSARGHRTGAESGPGAVQGTLALAFVLPSGLPAQPEAPPDLRLLPRPAADEDLDAAEFGPQPTRRADLPEPRAWAGRFVQAMVEVLAGDRPVGQLVRWTSAEVYDDLLARARETRPAGPGRAAGPARARVRSVHVAEPADGVAEVAAMVRRGARTTAVAVRLEGLDGRWQCTAVELG